MTGDLIHLSDFRRPRPNRREWTFDLAVFAVPGGSEAFILDTPHYDVPVRRRAEIESRCELVTSREIVETISGCQTGSAALPRG